MTLSTCPFNSHSTTQLENDNKDRLGRPRRPKMFIYVKRYQCETMCCGNTMFSLPFVPLRQNVPKSTPT
jgi:hypothetical protein